jgi:serine/threonine protein kinase
VAADAYPEVPGYGIERVLGQGGMGTVYEATQRSLGRRVALKVIKPMFAADEAFRARFRQEARVGATIHHPNILTVYEADETPDGGLFISMALVEGEDLSERLARVGRLAADEALAILVQVADALDAAHERRVIHRDVKPANVLLEETSAGTRAYVSDFGVAKSLDASVDLTAAGHLVGSLHYMSPEHAAGRPVNERADVYAFGCMLYECLTGERPFPHEVPAAIIFAHANAPIPVPSRTADVPEALDEVVRQTMEKDPERRAAAIGPLLRQAAGEGAASARRESRPTEAGTVAADILPPPPPPSPPERRGRRLWPRVAMYVSIYGPLWAAGYLLGRSI